MKTHNLPKVPDDKGGDEDRDPCLTILPSVASTPNPEGSTFIKLAVAVDAFGKADCRRFIFFYLLVLCLPASSWFIFSLYPATLWIRYYTSFSVYLVYLLIFLWAYWRLPLGIQMLVKEQLLSRLVKMKVHGPRTKDLVKPSFSSRKYYLLVYFQQRSTICLNLKMLTNAWVCMWKMKLSI